MALATMSDVECERICKLIPGYKKCTIYTGARAGYAMLRGFEHQKGADSANLLSSLQQIFVLSYLTFTNLVPTHFPHLPISIPEYVRVFALDSMHPTVPRTRALAPEIDDLKAQIHRTGIPCHEYGLSRHPG